MNKHVLFSPIGATDPVRDDYDGPMLHIVRHYKPTKVYLFYTMEMQRKREIVISALKEFEIDIEEIVTDIDAPHDFDIFAKTFDPLLNRIQEENKDSKIIVNISSGTPQMKSALCLEVVSSNLKLKAVQVTSPIKGSNENTSHGGNIEDNLDSIMENGQYITANRCMESNILTFKRTSVKRDIVSLVEHFEYRAAYEKLKENIDLFNIEALELIKYAMLRQNDDKRYLNMARQHSEFSFVKGPKEDRIEIVCNYYGILSNKAKTGELSYFVLLLKPLAEYVAKEFLGVVNEDIATGVLDEYYMRTKRKPYNPSRIKENYRWVVTYNLEQYIVLMEEKGIKQEIIEDFKKIEVQLNKRNELAHVLYREDKINPNYSLRLLRTLITEAFDNSTNDKNFMIYDLINERIKELI